MRPRCREWLPLCSQQLRLRNLQAIHGVNIELNPDDSSALSTDRQILVYYTLHHQPQCEPFYQSEKVVLQKHINVKWAEIQCAEILKSNANCVCIKVWACVKKTESFEISKNVKPTKYETLCAGEDRETLLEKKSIEQPTSALTQALVTFEKLPSPSDSLLFRWGVYFSGLIPFSQNAELKCCANSLIFQMNDEYFASPGRFSTECLRGQLALNYKRYSASVPKLSMLSSDDFNINSPQVSRSSSPTTVDWQNDLLRMSKTRYVQLVCLRSNVKKSYDLKKLLRLQQLQRERLQIQRESLEMTEDIKRLCIKCVTKEQLLRKARTTSFNSSTSSSTSTASRYHSMGRTLSLLLAEQHHVDPHKLLQAQQLQKQLEYMKIKQKFLISAKQTLCDRITYVRQKLNAATKSRQELKDWLSQQRRNLREEKFALKHLVAEKSELCVHRLSITQHVERVMFSLCLELRDIYPIERNSNGLYTICGVPFPSLDKYTLQSSVQSSNASENIAPMALSASLGYVAHLIQMISVVLNRPLRNPIIYEGSRTRIMDVIKEMPSFTSREFPLYSRSSIPTKPVNYAVNLLNQNIAQLCFDITGIRCDTRATMDNLLKMYARFVQMDQKKSEAHKQGIDNINKSSEIGGSHHSEQLNDNHNELHLPNQMSTKNGVEDYSLSKSHSSIDMNQMVPPTTIISHNMPVFSLTADNLLSVSHSIGFQNRSELSRTNQHRSCRSVGSYTDSEEEVCHSSPVKCFSNSESNLTSLQSGDHRLV